MVSKSIVSGMVGREILAELKEKKSSQWVHAKGRGITVRVRKSGHGVRQEWEPSGGILIEATMPSPSYGDRPETYSRRLSPGWNDEQFLQAIHHTFNKHRSYLRLLKYRDNVFAVCEPVAVEMDGEQLDAMIELGTLAGHSDLYGDMTIDDARYWIEQFRPTETRQNNSNGGRTNER